MSTSYRGPFEQDAQATWNNTQSSHQYNTHQPPVDSTYTLPNSTYGRSQWESDAQIAARKDMAKRTSRSFTSRVSRTKSRKKEMVGRPAKPTVDTSFARHRGALPRQIYPSNDSRNGGSVRRPGWFGLGRSGTKSKGLGIMKGTPQPEGQPVDFVQMMHRSPTAETLSPGTQTWQEVSPSDRPITIGISLPADSVPDLSPYQANRKRSESDVELVTPSIIITPAAAMKSIWSPDTESEYTPSIYSRGTFNPYATNSNIPPVPALPTSIPNSSTVNTTSGHSQNTNVGSATRNRNDTLDSAGTAFEDVEYEIKRKDRIMSSGTVFEEDEILLRDRKSTLSVDTSVVPTPRRSQGWWNYITTPFEFSRQNSIWTQGGRNFEKTPEIPMMPPRFLASPSSPSGRSTYIWSATDRSPSVNGEMPMMPIMLSSDVSVSNVNENRQMEQVQGSRGAATAPAINYGGHTNNNTNNITIGGVAPAQSVRSEQHENTSEVNTRDISSPLSAMSATPEVGTAAIGTVSMPRQIPDQQQQQQPINVNIIFQDKRADLPFQVTDATLSTPERSVNVSSSAHLRVSSVANVEMPTPATTFAHSPPQPQKPLTANREAHSRGNSPSRSPPNLPPPPMQVRHDSPMSTPEYRVNVSSSPGQSRGGSPVPEYRANVSATGQSLASYQFAPPPHSAQAHAYASNDPSRSSSPTSFLEKKSKSKRQHRKVFNIGDWLPFGRGSHNEHNHEQKKEKSRRKKWCWACCCCILILLLLAILIPVIVVVTRKNSNTTPAPGSPNSSPELTAPLEGTNTNWLNLTGYPPMPTGISTIAQPEAVEEESGCVALPATAWSCAVPKEDQQAIKPNKPDQPNLKLEITAGPSKTTKTRRAANPVSAGAFIRSLLNVRAAPSASPAPPSIDDYKFLGNTTDGNQAPFEGEATPFFLSLLNNEDTASSRLARRADITDGIPPPELNADGTAAPANLLPLVSNQPLRLLNRDKDDEHYGFFVYYDRSIFLKETMKNFTLGGNPADVDGGSAKDAATVRCTWTQTRFLVQIWTRSQTNKPLLGKSPNSDAGSDFQRPGSFPYPVTVSIDRHGGRAQGKQVYCYKMETDGSITNVDENKQLMFEDRKFGGNIVNPSQGPAKNVTGTIDGGTGGCRCQWQNWLG